MLLGHLSASKYRLLRGLADGPHRVGEVCDVFVLGQWPDEVFFEKHKDPFHIFLVSPKGHFRSNRAPEASNVGWE